MSKIFIEGLTVETTIGALAWEKQIKQKVIFDFEWDVDTAKAAAIDELVAVVDYAAVAEVVSEFVAKQSFSLIETLAENVYKLLQEKFSLIQLQVKVTKPGAIAQAKSVGVIIFSEE